MSIMPTDGAAYAQTIVNQSCSESLEANEAQRACNVHGCTVSS